ncbi:DUF2339 domain-containing protein [Pontibacter silvestris]|uniref:DUF2339 domain-containing protein n=1 Tax=Pontibacter silvestris TaxID=2305183 RepID=A0ABW4WYX7_9BACT|nr:DUF2339 domain-containing protein [Pontibacter silvestris]MCC9136839.1 DUF2339 domain-containing protein [Pontibacter silvestris]
MELTVLLLLIILMIWFAGRISGKLTQNTQELRQLNSEVQHLREQLGKQATQGTVTSAETVTKHSVDKVKRTLSSDFVPPTTPPLPKPAAPDLPLKQQKPAPVAEPETVMAFEATPSATPPPVASPPSKYSFFDRIPDWEKFIGENLINKLGIAILVIGIGFFVKYAIDQDWINEAGRVTIGILAGGVLLGVAHWLRQSYKAFSSVLVGGGLAVLYFTIAIAFHEYALFSQAMAFVLMVAITGFSIFLAIAYNRVELAALALVGGFASPFMVSTGGGSYIALFVFVLILNLGILVLAYFKKWNLLNIIAYVFTIVLYGGWLTTRVIGTVNPPYTGALVFATLFYLVFFLMNIINNIKEQHRFVAPEIMILLSNTFLYYSAGMYVLYNIAAGAYQGLFTIAIAVFNFVFAYLLYQNHKTDRNLVYLLIGLVLTFLSLAAPVQLEGNYITLFWALEGVLLLWLSQKPGIKLIRAASVIVLTLMFFSLAIDWSIYYDILTEPLRIIFNKVFITGAVAVTALAITLWLLQREQEPVFGSMLTAKAYRAAVGFVLAITLYLVLQLELSYQLDCHAVSYGSYAFIIGFYNYLFLLGLLQLVPHLAGKLYKIGALVLAMGGVVLYLLVLHPITMSTRDLYLQGNGATKASFLLHYLPLLLTMIILGALLRLIYQQYGFKTKAGKAALWFAAFVAVFLASAELEHLKLLLTYNPAESLEIQLTQVRKIGFLILWGVSSFILMMIGMRYKLKTLRIVSLSLFFLTLLKLFLFDIREISEGGKIAAFISLGILLLVVSFMYQKLKALILEDDAANASPGSTSDAP